MDLSLIDISAFIILLPFVCPSPLLESKLHVGKFVLLITYLHDMEQNLLHSELE